MLGNQPGLGQQISLLSSFSFVMRNPRTDKLSNRATNQVWARAYVGHTPANVDLLDRIVRGQELEVT